MKKFVYLQSLYMHINIDNIAMIRHSGCSWRDKDKESTFVHLSVSDSECGNETVAIEVTDERDRRLLKNIMIEFSSYGFVHLETENDNN